MLSSHPKQMGLHAMVSKFFSWYAVRGYLTCALNIIQVWPFQTIFVGGFNPFEKYARKIGSLPQIGMNIKTYLSCHHPVLLSFEKHKDYV